MVATQVLAKVEAGRLQKAVEGLVSGSYAITVTQQSEQEIRGFVANGDGKKYGVVLSEGQHFCSCPDSMYRRGICKHAVALALYALRNPQAKQSQQSRSWHVGDTVQRNGRTGTVVCVSGEFVSIRWDSGRTFPLTQEELEAEA
jgi:predicted nucleic acid-binding Zn finger protein